MFGKIETGATSGSAGITPAPTVPIAPPMVEGAALPPYFCSVIILKNCSLELNLPTADGFDLPAGCAISVIPIEAESSLTRFGSLPSPTTTIPGQSRRAINITDITRLWKRAELKVRIRNRWEKTSRYLSLNLTLGLGPEEILAKVLSFLFTLLLWLLSAVCSLHKNKAIKNDTGCCILAFKVSAMDSEKKK